MTLDRLAIRLGTLVLWIGLGIVGATVYGILNDQITVTLAPEYFSVFKREQFGAMLEQTGLQNAPTRVQALLIGTLATWWVGLFMGIVLSVCGMVGRQHPLPTRDYFRAIAGIMLFTLCVSVLFGSVAYLAEPLLKPTVAHWHFLGGIRDVRAAFAIGWWHNGAYLGGLAGVILAGYWAQQRRIALEKQKVIKEIDVQWRTA